LENDDTVFPQISQIFAQILVIFNLLKIKNHRNLRKNLRNLRENASLFSKAEIAGFLDKIIITN
jgi:hypothetical protein